MATPTLKDSGKREQFTTGSQRDTREGKGRFDLIPPDFIEALAKLYEDGAVKYDDNNWKKGQPLSRTYDSQQRHMNRWAQGEEDEEHLIQAAWNIIAIWWTQKQIRAGKLPAELGDYGPLVTSHSLLENVMWNGVTPAADAYAAAVKLNRVTAQFYGAVKIEYDPAFRGFTGYFETGFTITLTTEFINDSTDDLLLSHLRRWRHR